MITIAFWAAGSLKKSSVPDKAKNKNEISGDKHLSEKGEKKNNIGGGFFFKPVMGKRHPCPG